jgi:hypothetical protein
MKNVFPWLIALVFVITCFALLSSNSHIKAKYATQATTDSSRIATLGQDSAATHAELFAVKAANDSLRADLIKAKNPPAILKSKTITAAKPASVKKLK